MTLSSAARRLGMNLAWVGVVLVAGLVAAAGYHTVGVLLDFRAILGFPYGLDYGEGIVWQQAVLILGPRMYSPSQDLPFIVFHYPPLYHLAVRALMVIRPDPLAAGRLISMISTVGSAALTTLLVLAATRREETPAGAPRLSIAVAAGLIMLCLHAVRTWGGYMRVDMLALMLGLLGTSLAVWARGGFWGTTLALLACAASVFTKQTQLPAGIAVFLVAAIAAPRAAFGAAALTGLIGIAAVALLEAASGGGFLRNIIGYNLNTYSLSAALAVLRAERTSAPFALIMVLGMIAGVVQLVRDRGFEQVRRRDPQAMALAMTIIHFILAGILLLNVLKWGSNFNYFLDVLMTGCVLIGFLLCRIRVSSVPFGLAVAVLLLGFSRLPFRQTFDDRLAEWTARTAPVVARISAAARPVASDEMVMVMRAGQQLVYEPAIIQELIAAGRWEPGPLLDMIRAHGFAFVITWEREKAMGGPVVSAAILDAYPRLENVGPGVFIHHPKE